MQIEIRQIDELILADYNPRRTLKPGDKEYEKLKRSIVEFGYVDPVIVNNRTGKVIGGHQRIDVMKSLGYTDIEVSIVDLPDDREKAFLYSAFTNMLLASKAGASIYVTHADSERINFTKAFIDAGFYLSSVIIWVKNNSTFGRQDYKWKHEPMLYGWNANGGHKYYGSPKEDTIWEIDRPSRSEDHPTMKPVLLITRALNNSSKSDDIILDLFGGSGSTLIAAEQTQRNCFMMELDPVYCDVIIQRWEQFTGQKAKILTVGEQQ